MRWPICAVSCMIVSVKWLKLITACLDFDGTGGGGGYMMQLA